MRHLENFLAGLTTTASVIALTPHTQAASLTFLSQPEGLTDGLLETDTAQTGLIDGADGEPVRVTLNSLRERIEVVETDETVTIDFSLFESVNNPSSPTTFFPVPTDLVGEASPSQDTRDFTFTIDEAYDYTFGIDASVSGFSNSRTAFGRGVTATDTTTSRLPVDALVFSLNASESNGDGIFNVGTLADSDPAEIDEAIIFSGSGFPRFSSDDARFAADGEESEFSVEVSGTLPAGSYSINFEYQNFADAPGSAFSSTEYNFTASPANQTQTPAAVPTPSAAVAGLLGLGFAMRRRRSAG